MASFPSCVFLVSSVDSEKPGPGLGSPSPPQGGFHLPVQLDFSPVLGMGKGIPLPARPQRPGLSACTLVHRTFCPFTFSPGISSPSFFLSGSLWCPSLPPSLHLCFSPPVSSQQSFFLSDPISGLFPCQVSAGQTKRRSLMVLNVPPTHSPGRWGCLRAPACAVGGSSSTPGGCSLQRTAAAGKDPSGGGGEVQVEVEVELEVEEVVGRHHSPDRIWGADAEV